MARARLSHGLQDDVANEAVANDHIHAVPKQIVAFDVADEVQVQQLAELERFERQFVAFGVLGADAQNADPGILVAEDLARVNAAHDGVMGQVQGLALDVGAGIQQDEFMIRRGNDRGNAAPVNAGNPAQLESRGGEDAAGIAEGNHRIDLAFMHQLDRAGNRAILLLPQRGGGFVGHGQHLAGMDDTHAMVAEPALGQGGVDFTSVADQVEGGDSLVSLQSPLDAFDDHPATVVATHDIHCDSHRGTGRGETRRPRLGTVRLRRSR